MPEPPPETKVVQLGDLLPQEAIEQLEPVLNDLAAGRLAWTGGRPAIMWVLNRHREELERKGVLPEYLAATLLANVTRGGDLERFRPFVPPPGVPESTRDVLEATLRMAVPLWVEQFRSIPWEDLRRMADEASQFVAAHGDALMYRTKGLTAQAFNHLARGLAILSLMPGGVNFMGVHFETPKAEP